MLLKCCNTYLLINKSYYMAGRQKSYCSTIRYDKKYKRIQSNLTLFNWIPVFSCIILLYDAPRPWNRRAMSGSYRLNLVFLRHTCKVSGTRFARTFIVSTARQDKCVLIIMNMSCPVSCQLEPISAIWQQMPIVISNPGGVEVLVGWRLRRCWWLR